MILTSNSHLVVVPTVKQSVKSCRWGGYNSKYFLLFFPFGNKNIRSKDIPVPHVTYMIYCM